MCFRIESDAAFWEEDTVVLKGRTRAMSNMFVYVGFSMAPRLEYCNEYCKEVLLQRCSIHSVDLVIAQGETVSHLSDTWREGGVLTVCFRSRDAGGFRQV